MARPSAFNCQVRVHNPGMRRLLSITALLLLLASCVPASQQDSVPAGQTVIITNAPLEDAVPGLPEALGAALRDQPGCCSFEIHRAQTVRLHERHRDMSGHRGVISSAALARTLNAGWAVLISSHAYERTVTEAGELLYIDVSTAIRARIVDSEGTEYDRYQTGTVHGSRVQRSSEPLADLMAEPLLSELAGELLPGLVPQLAERLDELTH